MSTSGSGTLTRRAHRTATAPPWHAEVADLPPPSAYLRQKAILDRVLAALLLAPGLPIIGLLVLLVRLTSRGPGIYRQVRVGQRGWKFTMYKIRTMKLDAEAASGPTWTQSHDPRTTMLGRVLRHIHLDELPQLFNVLKGEMSLVGPRPERPEFVHVLAESIPGYVKRLAMPPGVTGLAQLNLPPDTDLTSVRRKLVLDCMYIEEAGLLLDLRILASTFIRMLRVPERWLLQILGLHRSVDLPEIIEGSSDHGSNGASHAAATPKSISVQAASAPTKSNGRRKPR